MLLIAPTAIMFDTHATSVMKTHIDERLEWAESQKILAADGEANDVFGRSVSFDGDTAVIGAHCDNDLGLYAGSAYVFTDTNGTWEQQQKLTAPDGGTFDYFGWSVMIQADTIIIGAKGDNDYGSSSGSAYIFVRTGGSWVFQAKLHASDASAGDEFGYIVSLHGDTALVGAPSNSDAGPYSGSAYVFVRDEETWTQQAKLLASDGSAQDAFGCAVVLNDDTALIGADGKSNLAGATYVFTRDDTTWTQEAKLVASDQASGDEFGFSLSFQGDTALIGAYADNDNGVDSGSAYVFVRDGSIWAQQAKLLSSDGEVYDYFGYAVTVHANTALIAAPFEDENGDSAGSVYIFNRSGPTWTQTQKLLASDGEDSAWFGDSVFLQGHTAFIAAYGDDGLATDSGAVYVFSKENVPPIAGFSWSPEHPDINEAVLFNASTSYDPDGVIDLYEWDWESDGVFDENSTTPTAVHSWSHGGTYDVSLRVTDSDGTTAFITQAITLLNHPPSPPVITGPSSGKVKAVLSYNFTAVDPDDNMVSYWIEWGDETSTGWTNLSASGVPVTVTHTWTKKGTYSIKAKAKDSNGNESDWGTFTVILPLSYEPPAHPFLLWLFDRFPHAFPILRHLLG